MLKVYRVKQGYKNWYETKVSKNGSKATVKDGEFVIQEREDSDRVMRFDDFLISIYANPDYFEHVATVPSIEFVS